MRFVNELHKAGIGVIMDFVPVHFVRDDYALRLFDGTPTYEYDREEDANSQWDTLNFNLWKEEVRSFLMSAANFWLEVYHFDGLRMDAISNAIYWHGNKNNGVNEGACDFMKRMNYMLNEAHDGRIMLIAEDSTDFPNVTKSTLDGGLGFDYKWDMGWMNDTLAYLKKILSIVNGTIMMSLSPWLISIQNVLFCHLVMMKWYMESVRLLIKCGEAMMINLHRHVLYILICLLILVKN